MGYNNISVGQHSFEILQLKVAWLEIKCYENINYFQFLSFQLSQPIFKLQNLIIVITYRDVTLHL